MNLKTELSETGIILIILLLSGVLWKGCNRILASNCTEVSTPCLSCKRPPLENESALELMNNQSHVNQHTLHEIVVEEIKKDIEEGK